MPTDIPPGFTTSTPFHEWLQHSFSLSSRDDGLCVNASLLRTQKRPFRFPLRLMSGSANSCQANSIVNVDDVRMAHSLFFTASHQLHQLATLPTQHTTHLQLCPRVDSAITTPPLAALVRPSNHVSRHPFVYPPTTTPFTSCFCYSSVSYDNTAAVPSIITTPGDAFLTAASSTGGVDCEQGNDS